MLCPQCGVLNPTGATECLGCGFVPPPEPPPSPDIEVALLKLVETIRALEKGQMTRDEFLAFLDSRRQACEASTQTLLNLDPEVASALAEPLAMDLGGINLYQEGLARLAVYADSHEQADRDAALVQIKEANDILNAARRRHIAFQETLLASAEDMVRQFEKLNQNKV